MESDRHVSPPFGYCSAIPDQHQNKGGGMSIKNLQLKLHPKKAKASPSIDYHHRIKSFRQIYPEKNSRHATKRHL
jgi:hypothetical protein